MKHLTLFIALISLFACAVASDDTENQRKRPCGSGDIEKDCVREYFAEHAACSVVTQPDNEDVQMKNGVFFLPFANVSAFDDVATLTNLDGTLREFSINEETGYLLYSVKMVDMSYYTPAVTFHFYQMDEEPIVITDELYEAYPHVVFTAQIPLVDGKVTRWSMEKTLVTSFFLSVGTFTMEAGTNFTESENPQVIKVFQEMANNQHLVMQEPFVTKGPLIFRAHVQKYICDFGLPIAM